MSLGVVAEQRTRDGLWHRVVTNGDDYYAYEVARLEATGWSGFRIVRTFTGEAAERDAFRCMAEHITVSLLNG